MNNDTPVFILGGVQRCGQHCLNNYIQAAYTTGAFKNDAPAKIPLAEDGAYKFIPFAQGLQVGTWENSPLERGVTAPLLQKYDCLSLGVENYLFDLQWAREVVAHCAEFSVSSRNLYLLQVVRSPLNNIASICKMWGNEGSGSWGKGALQHLGLVAESAKRYVAAVEGVEYDDAEKHESDPDIFYVEYDRFVSDKEYRYKFYTSLPRTTEGFDSCENVLNNKVQLSSFSIEEDYDFNNRYKAMQNDPLVKSFVTEELVKLNEKFLHHAFS